MAKIYWEIKSRIVWEAAQAVSESALQKIYNMEVQHMYTCSDPVCDPCCDFCWYCIQDEDGQPIICEKNTPTSFWMALDTAMILDAVCMKEIRTSK